MINDSRVLSILGLARKAGKLTLGYDAVTASMQSRSSSLVLVTNDLSARTLKNIEYTAKGQSVKVMHMGHSMDDTYRALGKTVGIISVNSEGFALKIQELLKST